MTVLDRLEQQLVASVEAGATQPVAPQARRGWWRRGGGRTPLLVAVGALLVAGGGAVAATGGLPIGKEDLSQVETRPPNPDAGAGAVRGPRDVLSPRVADPAGGPPWALRVFATSRGTSCVQVGQVYRGVFGAVSADATGAVAFRPVRARPGDGSLCVSSISHGFPVMHGQSRTVQVGGSGDARRCGATRGPCPISDVRVIRYGLLGQAARGARLIAPDGRARASMALSPGAGGAYLFVTPVSAAPFQRNEDREALTGRVATRTLRREQAAGVPFPTAARRANAAVTRAMRSAPRGVPYPELPGMTDAVVATFVGGVRQRVSGPHHSRAPLPGVGRARPSSPATRAPLDVRVAGRDARRRFDVSFRAPVAVTKAVHGYRLTVSGTGGAGCRAALGGHDATTRNIAAGAVVRFAVRPAGGGSSSWCPGPHLLRVGFHRPGDPAGGRLVGAYAFHVR